MNNNRIPRFLQAGRDPLAKLKAEADQTLRAMGTVVLEAKAADDKGLRKFSMDAYNGGSMNFWWSDVPVVVDLAGMKISAKSRPIFKDHNPGLVVGHSGKVTNDHKTLKVEGIASGTGAAAQEVIANSDNGFPWQSSIGTSIDAIEEVSAGKQTTVNSQSFTGPLLIVRASTLSEISFVALGADDSTLARMVAGKSATNKTQGKQTMDKFKILAAALVALAASFPHLANELVAKAEVVADDSEDAKKGAADLKAWAESQPKAKVQATVEDTTAADLKAARQVQAAETSRVADIREICASKHPKIEAKAILEGWTKDKTELEVLRASRAAAPGVTTGTHQSVVTREVLEAGLLLATRPDQATLKKVKEKDLEAAVQHFGNDMSLGSILFAAARCNGYNGHSRKVDREVLRAAFAPQLQASGFSTVDISGILSNVANKMLLEGFMGVEAAWRAISSISPANDFKTMTRYRLTGVEKYEKVAPGGEIKHGTLGQESYTNKVDTFALMLAITRNDIINDDLGALATVPRKLGRGAGLKLNEVFWAEFLDDSAFFPTNNSKSNYIAGATTNLSIVGLQQGVTKFRRQVDANGNPIGVEPKILLTPPELEGTNLELSRSTLVNSGGASTVGQIPNANVYAGRFTPVISQYLTQVKRWYLLADPRDLAVMDVAFLNGQESPTVESAQADFDTLGIEMRGYHDFGCAKAEYRGGVKSKGEA